MIFLIKVISPFFNYTLKALDSEITFIYIKLVTGNKLKLIFPFKKTNT